MTVLVYVAIALLTFVVLVAVLGLLPAWLSVRAARSQREGRRSRLRIMQSNIALLVVAAAAATFLGARQLIVAGATHPFFLGLAAAGVAVAVSSISTYVWLERQIP